ncbi:MAG: type II toxin-antitoxin system RnlB family antitoxin [Enterococcus aquimarinus]|uniref:Type II toxin-antitoxin system RnlB family antitoxin n=1 Tax=Enterococcus aquimarinus TaxID=328396 RepID=A0A9E3ZU17_9ENTE|nr:type II toxin-antitoxin system RnlB family antitoxin [Enterococcus aquimarinus]
MNTMESINVEKTKYFEVLKLDDSEFMYFFVLLSHISPSHLLKKEAVFCSDVSGKILVDRMLHVGNSRDRYVSYNIIHGNIEMESRKVEKVDRKSTLRMLGNSCYKSYPNLVNNSILNSTQKKLLLHGLSI